MDEPLLSGNETKSSPTLSLAELQSLCEMRRDGMLTDAEFAMAKEKLLGVKTHLPVAPTPSFTPPPPTAEVMLRDATSSVSDFQFDAAVANGCCEDSTLKMPRYVAKQWGGRFSERDYSKFVDDINTYYTGTYQTGVCKATLYGCVLFSLCAGCEECYIKNGFAEFVDDLSRKQFQPRGITIDAIPSMQQRGDTTSWRFSVRFD
ncbi:hypothetical protein TeGR_g7989 [Tetraparma gracilis]|uniref:SHOCT domain-containing protein n=1 Tax=Tetraparma gracilis TaxID=2962635 RepID=A0ABQ6MWU3_9STRA|nr:hypothetical protein TeGR_g7989 [Tetraparma gracilis]